MPVMFKELHGPEFYSFDQNEQGATGRRTFQRNDAAGDVAAADLPAIGVDLMVDEADDDVANCLCRSKSTTFLEGDENTLAVVFEYSTKAAGGGDGGNGPRDTALEDFELSGEEEVIQAYPAGRRNVFEFVDAANDDVKWANQGIPRKLFAGTFNIPYWDQALDETGRNAFIALVKTLACTINSVAIRTFAIGQVRFDGVSGGAYRDQDGDVKWAFTCHFSFRVLGSNLAGTAITSHDWLYQVNENEGVYRKVRNHDTDKYLYEEADFSPLLAEPEPP